MPFTNSSWPQDKLRSPRSCRAPPTWQSASSIGHRIDYVTVPRCWAASVTQTGVFGFDLLALDGHLDHASPWLEVLLQAERKPKQRRKLWYARQALKLPEVQEAVSAEWARALPLPTSWDSELASAAIAKFSRMALAQHCPPGTPAPKQKWISSTSWDLMRLHAAERRRWFGAIRSRRQALCRVLFAAWRDAAAGEQVPQSGTRVWVEWSLSISARLRSLKEAAPTSRKAVESDFKAGMKGRLRKWRRVPKQGIGDPCGRWYAS